MGAYQAACPPGKNNNLFVYAIVILGCDPLFTGGVGAWWRYGTTLWIARKKG